MSSIDIDDTYFPEYFAAKAMKQPPQPEQEPVADVRLYEYLGVAKNGAFFEAVLREGARVSDGDKLYTTPPQRKPLTDEQREEIAKGWRGRNWTVGDIIDAVEAAHGIKE